MDAACDGMARIFRGRPLGLHDSHRCETLKPGRSVRILQTNHSSPDLIPSPVLDPQQVVCGPQYPDRHEAGRVLSLRTSRGEYDLEPVIARLPPEQQPELLVVRADSSLGSLPRNLGSHRAVLVVGDTHHNPSPITSLLNYALSEPFECVILDYTRQHAHFFAEVGLERVYWLPGFNVERIVIPSMGGARFPMSFVGTVGPLHGRRNAVLEALHRAGLPIEVLSASRQEARLLHAGSAISLNCSLNGCLNLRTLEIVASGSCLVTDRLGPESGLDILLEEAREYIAYDSIEDCVEKCRRYLHDFGKVTEIAQTGKAAYERTLAPERIRQNFFELISDGIVRPEFGLNRDRRFALEVTADRAKLMARIAVYEVLQAMQRANERSSVLVAPSVDPRVVSDAIDLARVETALDATTGAEAWKPAEAFWRRVGLGEGLRRIRRREQIETERWDGVIATCADWRSRCYDTIFERNSRAVLIVPDLGNDGDCDRELAAAGFIRLTDRAPVFTK